MDWICCILPKQRTVGEKTREEVEAGELCILVHTGALQRTLSHSKEKGGGKKKHKNFVGIHQFYLLLRGGTEHSVIYCSFSARAFLLYRVLVINPSFHADKTKTGVCLSE